MNRKQKPIHKQQSPQSANKQRSQPATPTNLSFSKTFSSIPNLQATLTKQMHAPIQIYQSLYQSNMAQKCLAHNIAYSLYCQTDHKILCSRCIMQNNAHKLHTVKPINQVLNNLSKDCEQLTKDVQTVLAQFKNLIEQNIGESPKIQRQYPIAKDKLQQIFRNLHQYLFDQEKQLTKQLRNYKTYLLQQQKAVTLQLTNVYNFVETKFNKYKAKNSQQQLLMKKNIFAILKQSNKLTCEKLNIQTFEAERKTRYKYQEDILEQLKEVFLKEGEKWFPWGKIKQMERKAKEQRKQLLQSKSKEKQKHNGDNSKQYNSKSATKLNDKSTKKQLRNKIKKNLKKLNETQVTIRKSSKSIFPITPKNSRLKRRASSRSLSKLSNLSSSNDKRKRKLMMRNGLLPENKEHNGSDHNSIKLQKSTKKVENKISNQKKGQVSQIKNQNKSKQKITNQLSIQKPGVDQTKLRVQAQNKKESPIKKSNLRKSVTPTNRKQQILRR